MESKIEREVLIPREFNTTKNLNLKTRNIAQRTLNILRDYTEELALEYIVLQEPNLVEEEMIKHHLKELAKKPDTRIKRYYQ